MFTNRIFPCIIWIFTTQVKYTAGDRDDESIKLCTPIMASLDFSLTLDFAGQLKGP